MSLNRTEQRMLNYVEANPDELRFWQDRVQRAVIDQRDHQAAATWLADELWRYFEERSAVAKPFTEWARTEGVHRTSMRNLAEYWLRLWVGARPKPSDAETTYDGIRISR